MTSIRQDPLGFFKTELAASNAVARIAAHVKAGEDTGLGGSILINQLSVLDDAERMRTRFPAYSRSLATEELLARLARDAANPDIADLRRSLSRAGALADELAHIDRDLDEAMQAHLPKMLADTADGMAAHLARRDFRAEAVALLDDMGIAGKLSSEQVTGLAEILEADANKSTAACKAVVSSGKLDVARYFAMLAANAKEGLAALERLREHFKVDGS